MMMMMSRMMLKTHLQAVATLSEAGVPSGAGAQTDYGETVALVISSSLG